MAAASAMQGWKLQGGGSGRHRRRIPEHRLEMTAARMAAMRLIAICGALVVFSSASAPAIATDPTAFELTVVRNHQRLKVSNPRALVEKLISLLESCSVNSTSYARPQALWDGTLAAPSFIHVRFTLPQDLRAMIAASRDDDSLGVRQILLALPSGKLPDHVLVKTGAGTFAFTKYAPRAWEDLFHEPVLGLSTAPCEAGSCKGAAQAAIDAAIQRSAGK